MPSPRQLLYGSSYSTGDGIRSTKKAAQTIAAYKVCVQLGLVE
jgi:hypothetical protein